MKKRIISLLVAIILLVGQTQSIVVSAETATDKYVDNLTWALDDTGKLTISGTGAMTDYGSSKDVPWHYSRTSIKTVIIEDGVTSIGSYAFFHCTSLTNITIPDSVTSIGKSAFDECQSLTSVTIPNSVTSIGESAFASCWNLTSVTLPDNITRISGWTFSDCNRLQRITIPDGITSIGNGAFYDCRSLPNITIPDSVTKIDYHAFQYCTGLTDIYYTGSEEEWGRISIGSINTDLTNTTIHYNSDFGATESKPNGAKEYNGHRYQLITKEMNWIEADEYCRSIGGHLVTITSAEENSFVQSLINKSTMIGLSDAVEEGAWAWVTGESLTYTNWAKNEPNNQSNEDYVLMQVKGTWNDGHLDREKWPFICEWDETTLPNKTYSVEEIEQMVADYFNANYQDASNPGKFVVFHGETSVIGNKCSIVVRFQSSSNSPNTAANVLFAYVSVNMETGVMTIEGVNGDADVPLFDPGIGDEPIVVPGAIRFSITTDHTSLSVRKNNKLLLGAGLFLDGVQIDDTSGITFQIEDSSILEVSASFAKDNYLYASFNALKEGTTNVIFSDSNSGAIAMIPVTVYSDSYLCYTLSSVPTQQIEKYPTNFYNVNGLYVDSYTYTVNSDKSASVSFDVYNSNYTYGAVEVYDVNGNLKSAVLINKMSSSMTSMKEVLWDDVVYLVRDIYDGDLLSYRQESGFSKKTPISVTIPENGYIKICNDPENSFIVSLVNSADILLSLASFMGEVKNYDVNSTYFSEKLTTKLVNEKIFAECVKDGSKLPKKLWSNVGKATISSPTALATSCETLVQNISELELEDLIISTAMDFGVNVGEETFTYFVGPFGAALKAIFAVGKMENILVQHAHMTKSAGIGSIYIQNQGGGVLGSQQITVESENGFEPDTALRVFSVTIDPDILSKIATTNPKLHEAITGKSSYTYDISLLKNGDATQPGDKVTVCIPIPEAWRMPMPNDLKEGIYAGIFKIYRIEEDGTTTEMQIDVKDGCFVFETDHFSLYTLVKYDVEQSDDNTGLSSDSFAPWMIPTIVAAGVCCSALVVFCIVILKKKKKA